MNLNSLEYLDISLEKFKTSKNLKQQTKKI